MESPLSFRANWRTTTRNQEGPTTNGYKAHCQKHFFHQTKSNENWHKEQRRLQWETEFQPQENVKKKANNSRDDDKTGITTALLQKGPVLLQKRDPFCKGVY